MHDIQPPRQPRPIAAPGRQSKPSQAGGPADVPKPSAPPVTQPIPKSAAHLVVATPPKPKKRRYWWLWAIAGLALILIFSIIAAAAWYNDSLKAKSSNTTSVEFVVEQGETWDAVTGRLEQNSLIKSGVAAMIYVRLHNPGDLKTGAYMFTPSQSVPEIIAWLAQGKVGTQRITILPGKTLVDLRANFIKDGYDAKEVDEAFAATYDHPLLADKPAHATLEGYIYPETYFIHANESLKQVLTRSFDEFQKQLEAKDIRAQLKAKGFSLYQGITLASMIETEVGSMQDRRQVAQVFLTRLQKGMVLGSDVTYKYAAKQLGVAATPALDSPYNTRIKPGLPPGPIANVTVPVIETIINPAPGDYIYFVSGDDGTTHFSHTFEQHEENIKKYCTTLCFGE